MTYLLNLTVPEKYLSAFTRDNVPRGHFPLGEKLELFKTIGPTTYANGKYPILIPCPRVIGSDGSLSRYHVRIVNKE